MADTAQLTVRIGANIKDFEKKMNNMQGKMDKIGSGLSKAGKGMTAAVTAPILGLGTAAFAAANDFDKAYNTIQVGTGATGKDLEGLKQNFENVFTSIPTDSQTASDALATLNTSTGATGDVLEGLTTSVLEASRMMGEDGSANAQAFGKALQQWGVPAEQGEAQMDSLFKATQDYGIGLGELTSNLSEYGPVLSNAGFEMNEAADLFGRMEKGGINVSRIMPGLNMAFRNWADEGKNSREEFDKTISKMQDAETETEALGIATEQFGAEGAQRLTTAVRNGTIPSLEELGTALEGSEGTVAGLSEETKTVGDRFTEMKNRIQTAVAPLGEVFMQIAEDFEPVIMDLISGVESLGNWFSNLSGPAQMLTVAIGAIVAAIGPLLMVLGSIIGPIAQVVTAFGGFVKVGLAVGGAIAKVAGVFGMLLNPVGLIITGITALAGVFIYLWNTNETFKNAVIGIWNTIRDTAVSVFGHITSFLSNVWTKVSEAAVATWNYITEFLSAAWQGILGIATPIFNRIANFIGNVWTVISTMAQAGWNVVTTILTQAWNALLKLVMPVFNQISTFISTVWTVISTATSVAWDFISDKLGTVWNWISNTATSVFNSIANFLSNIWTGVSSAAQTAWDFISNMLMTAWNNIVAFAQPIFNRLSSLFSVIWNTIKSVTTTVWNTISTMLSTVWGMIQTLASGKFNSIGDIIGIVWDTIKSLTSTVWNAIKDIFNSVVSGIVDFGRTYFNMLKDAVSTIFSSIASFFSSIWNGIKSTFNTVINAIVNFAISYFENFMAGIERIFNWISNFFTSVWNVIKNTFTRVVRNIVTSVMDRWRSLSDTTSRIFNSVKNFLSNLWSTIWSTISDVVSNIFNTVVEGWQIIFRRTENIFNNIFEFLSNLWNRLWNRITNLANDIWTGVTDAWDGLWESTKSVFNDIKDWVSDTFDNIVDWATDLPGRIGDAISNAASAAVDGVKSMGNDMAGALQDVLDGITGGLNKILDAIGLDMEIGSFDVPTFSTGTRNGRIANDGPGILNDKGPGNGRGGATQELIQRGNKMLAPQGKNAFVGLKKGDRIFNGAETQSMIASGKIPRFSQGTGSEGGNTGDDKGLWGSFTDMVSNVWDFITEPGKAMESILDTITPDFGGLSGFAGDMVSGSWDLVKDTALDWLTGIFEDNAGGLGTGSSQSFMNYRQTTPYSPNSPVPGYPTSFNNGHHYGIDYATPIGTPVHAPTAGKVSSLNNNGGGLVAKLKSGELTQFFMHLSDIVKTGSVGAGDLIAKTGNSGQWTTGAHIHWQAQQGSDVINNSTINPKDVLAHARGGIFDQPHFAEIAEEGPEAVIPLSANQRGRANQIYDQVGGAIGRGSDKHYEQMIDNQQKQINQMNQAINYLAGIEDKSGITENDVGKANANYSSRESSKHRKKTGRLNYGV
ncbi:phage tail tape measure protein [Salinicoccus albus]|uniref:phage tail tape measure protein n=1 Tax=Salinicoccus albus TaxID=418756 RepID=UPI000368FBBD|nr:phage tail tape measure protein [Salinicoccus albus]